MNFGLDVSLRLQQKMSFNMIQSLKLLQVNTLELEQMLQAELEQNPLLELDEDMAADADADDEERTADADDKTDDADDKDKSDDSEEYLEELTGSGDDDGGIDWEEYLEDGFDAAGSYRDEADPNEERYEPTAVYEETLEERLLEQLSEKNESKRVKQLAEYMIYCLDDDGYLRVGVEEIAARAKAAECEVADALSVLQRLDPPGVGARDLRECLMLQLRAKGMDGTLAMEIVSGRKPVKKKDGTSELRYVYWEHFEKMKILDIARMEGVEPRQVQEAVEIIAGLDPKPGHRYGADKAAAVVPDLIVRKIDGRFIATLNDGSIPSLYINKRYASMIRRGSKAKREVKEYVRQKFNHAALFIRAIEQRRVTMLRVMNAIVERQKAFFEYGPPNIVPLKQLEVARDIGMHLSTVSRVVNNKYVQTPHGIFELRYFFTEAVGAHKKRAKNTGPIFVAAAGNKNVVNNGDRFVNNNDSDSVDDNGFINNDNEDYADNDFINNNVINNNYNDDDDYYSPINDVINGVVIIDRNAFKNDRSDNVTAERIKDKIRQLIDGEDTADPLSDQRISDILGKEGIKTARRTVAKYREQMRIPPTRMRQTYG